MFDLIQQRVVLQNRAPQIGPILPPPTRNEIVDGGERETLMVEVAMQHDDQDILTILSVSSLADEVHGWQQAL